jgi:phosphoadenosine phosphosulfate reductase
MISASAEIHMSPTGVQALDRRLAAISGLEDRIAVIATAIEGKLAFSTSLGLEDQAILHAIASSQVTVDVFTLDTGRHFPETLQTLNESELRYGLRIRVVAPDASEVEELVARDGIMGFRLSIENRKACCEVRKVRPLKRALNGAAGWITGLRREQSAGRSSVALAEWDEAHGLVKLNPLAD